MKTLVADANIFIDFEQGGVIAQLFALPEQLIVPDFLYEQELRQDHEYLVILGLKPMSLTEKSMLTLAAMSQQYQRVSVNDLSALALAKQESCPLITGDKNLRRVTDAEGVTLRGTLWLARRIHEEGKMNSAELRQAFDRMRDSDRRLPWAKVDSILDELRLREIE